MSEHDIRDDYDDEPWRGRVAPEDIVRLPASVMWVFGLLQLIITQMALAFFVCGTAIMLIDEHETLRDLWESPDKREGMALVLAGWLVATPLTIVVMRGANDLKRFRRYRWVVVGAILTFLSVPFFYLGVVQVPLGIWLFVLLIRRDVRARFEAVARGTMKTALPEAGDARADRTP